MIHQKKEFTVSVTLVELAKFIDSMPGIVAAIGISTMLPIKITKIVANT